MKAVFSLFTNIPDLSLDGRQLQPAPAGVCGLRLPGGLPLPPQVSPKEVSEYKEDAKSCPDRSSRYTQLFDSMVAPDWSRQIM